MPEPTLPTVADRSVIEAVVAMRFVIVPDDVESVVMLALGLVSFVIVADVAVRFVAVKSVTVDDVKVKLLIVALVAVKFVTVQLEPSSVPTVPTVADKSEIVAVVETKLVIVPLGVEIENALEITALEIVLSVSVAGISALTKRRKVELASPPLAGPA